MSAERSCRGVGLLRVLVVRIGYFGVVHTVVDQGYVGARHWLPGLRSDQGLTCETCIRAVYPVDRGDGHVLHDDVLAVFVCDCEAELVRCGYELLVVASEFGVGFADPDVDAAAERV